MESKTWKCDCGCGKSSDGTEMDRQGWLSLEQRKYNNQGDDRPKLGRNIHFYSFECGERYFKKAVLSYPKLQEASRGVYPRGMYPSPECPGLYV